VAGGLAADAVWLDRGRLIALVTMGSSSAAPFVEQVTVAEEDPQHVEVELGVPDVPMTRDRRPRITVLVTPAGVDPSKDATLSLTGAVEAVAVLSGRAELASAGVAADGAPSAAWTSVPGQFILLTWGASLPPLELEAAFVDATSPSDVIVRFEPPATARSTRDLSPRLTLGVVSAPVRRPATAVLSGRPDVDGRRVPIL
jgi:hypothetical protein